jgi:hypothetical protein
MPIASPARRQQHIAGSMIMASRRPGHSMGQVIANAISELDLTTLL